MNAGKLARGIVVSLWLGACGSAHEKNATSSIMQSDGAMPSEIAPPISSADAATSAMNEKTGDAQRGPRAPGDRGDGADAGVDKPGRVGPDGMRPDGGPAGMPGMPPPPHAGEMAPPAPGMKPPHAGEKAPPAPGMEPPPHAGMMAPAPHAGDHA
jgi:hypothetical protein